MCAGTSSTLFDTRMFSFDDPDLFTYLYKVCKIDQTPITDHNGVVNLVQFLSAGYIDEKKAAIFQEWIRLHKRCGMYIYRA
jgi:hypothetical protein